MKKTNKTEIEIEVKWAALYVFLETNHKKYIVKYGHRYTNTYTHTDTHTPMHINLCSMFNPKSYK